MYRRIRIAPWNSDWIFIRLCVKIISCKFVKETDTGRYYCRISNSNSIIYSDTVTLELEYNTHTAIKSNDIWLEYNPNARRLIINNSIYKDLNVSIYNTSGQLISVHSLHPATNRCSAIELNLSEAGFYIAVLKSGENIMSYKFLVNK